MNIHKSFFLNCNITIDHHKITINHHKSTSSCAFASFLEVIANVMNQVSVISAMSQRSDMDRKIWSYSSVPYTLW